MRLCSIIGCERKHCAKGYCKTHYYRILKRESDNYSPEIITKAVPGSGYLHKDKSGGFYKCFHKNGKKVWEHRMVMEATLGRSLLSNENVHHINGNKLDNRSENLELWVTSQPSGQRPQDLVVYAKQILALYDKDTTNEQLDTY